MVLEQFANNASSSLNGAIDNSVTSIIVATGQGSRFPSSGNFRLLFGSNSTTGEIVLATAISSDTITVVRGQEGTTAQSWPNGTTVTHILTKGAAETLRDTLKGKTLSTSLETIGSSQDGYILTWDNTDGYWLASPSTGAISSASLAADITIPNDSANWTNLVSLTAYGSNFLILSEASGLTGGGVTGRLRLLVDGSPVYSTYGAGVSTGGAGAQVTANYYATGYSVGNHTIALQGQASGSTWSIHASTNPTYEGAKIFVSSSSVSASPGSFAPGGDLSGTNSSQQVISITGSSGVLNVSSAGATITWSASTSSPTLKQADNINPSVTASALAIQAQNATGATSTGGDVIIQSGTGTTAAGSVKFNVGSSLVAYTDSTKAFRLGASAASSTTIFTSATLPRNQQDALYLYDASNGVNAFFISGLASSRSIVSVLNTSNGSTSTIGVRLQAAGNSDVSYTNIGGNANIEHIGSSTSSLIFTSVLGDGTTRAGLGRMYKSGAWTIGDASNQNTSSGAQAGLSGPLINLGSSTGTMTSAANQSLLFNQSGDIHVQGNTSVRFDVGTNLAGYFDSNRTLRAGLNPSTNISVLGGTNNEPGNGIFCYNAGGFSTVTNASGTASTEAIVSIFNTAAGGSLTTGLRLVGAGSANGNADWVSNGVIEQVGESTSALVFSSITGAGASRATTGRIYRSGAWTVGSASNNNTSSGAQAGLTGSLLNLSGVTGGTLTSTTNQSVVYNSAGTLVLQGNIGQSFIAGTTTIAGTSTNKFITNVGRRIATNVKTANYTVTTSDEVILVGALATSITITLPTSPTAGDTYTIKDQGGSAGTFNIIISGNGPNIDGASTYTMNLSYESVTVVFGNSTWSII